MLASWNEGVRLALRKNPRYWDAASIHLDELDILENVPHDVDFSMFENGDLESIADLAPSDAMWIKSQPAWAPYLRRPGSCRRSARG